MHFFSFFNLLWYKCYTNIMFFMFILEAPNDVETSKKFGIILVTESS
jgi:hypothetical protein